MRLSPGTARWRLLRAHVPADLPSADLPALARRLQDAARDGGLSLVRAALRRHGAPGPGADEATGLLHVYLGGDADAGGLDATVRSLPAAWRAEAATLELAFDTPGAAAGQPARFHYVVETDPEAGWADEIARWYDEEHMPGLAAVPGCVRAVRAIRPERGPRSLAAYDLVAAGVLGSPAWLAVRATAWSDRARPHFTNTRRTMFEVIA